MPNSRCHSLCADNGAFLLTSRKEVEQAVPLLFSFLKAFGLSVHVGCNGNKAKTEAIFYLSAAQIKNPDPIDTQDIEVDGGIVSFTKQFKYLGSLIAGKLTDNAECNTCISAVSKVFGALKTQLFGVLHICTRAKKHAYKALVLSLLFYSSECWILSASMRDKILKFHRHCIRFMCGVTLDLMQSKHIHHTDLEKHLCISDVLSILVSHRLQWLGHIYRMPMCPMHPMCGGFIFHSQGLCKRYAMAQHCQQIDYCCAFSLHGSQTQDPKDVHTLHMGMD
jgi:hypothetical protein